MTIRTSLATRGAWLAAGRSVAIGVVKRLMSAFASIRIPLRDFAVAADRLLAGFPDSLEIAPVRTANTDGVVDAIAEAVRQDGVVHVSVAALSLGAWEVLVGGHPVSIRP